MKEEHTEECRYTKHWKWDKENNKHLCDCFKNKEEQIEKEYKKDYEYAIKHPVKGVKCGKCWEVYYHPVLGCAKCGKYSYKYKSEESKEEQISDSWEEELENLPNTNMTTKDFIKQTLAKQKEEVVKICKDYIKEVDGCDDVKIIIKRINLITDGK